MLIFTIIISHFKLTITKNKDMNEDEQKLI